MENEKTRGTEQVMATVRKLLDRAAHPNTPEAEAQTCTDKANALMAKHAINEAMLQDQEVTESDVEMLKIHVAAPYARERVHLLHVVAKYSGCETVSIPRRWRYGKNYEVVKDRNGKPVKDANGKPVKRRKVVFMYSAGVDVKIWGFRSDLERVELLYTSLLLQGTRDMQRSQPLPGEDPGAHRSSWLIGFASSVGRRMKAAADRAKSEAPASNGRGADLVLADRKSLVSAAYAKAVDNPYSGSPLRSSGSGFGDGYRSGDRADLGGKRVENRRTTAIG